MQVRDSSKRLFNVKIITFRLNSRLDKELYLEA